MPGEWVTQRFVGIKVLATGREESVPEEWLGNEAVLPAGSYEVVQAASGPVDPAEVPTDRDTHEVIDAFAQEHGIDLGEAGTKAEKLDVIEQAVAAAVPPAPPSNPANPGVETVLGESLTESPYPYLQTAQNQTTDDAASSDENPATGDEE